MDENVINSLFGCFRVLRIVCKKKNSFASLTRSLRASLRTLVNYFSVIDPNNQLNSI